jgi:putative cardiolipin synthase
LITGGRNIKNEYFGLDCVNYVDRDLYIRGCAAQCAQAYFVERWNSCDVHPADLRRVSRDVLKYQKHHELNNACDEFAIQQAAWLLDQNCCCLQQCGFIRFDSGNDWSAGAVEVDCTRFMHDFPGVNKRCAGIGPDMLALLAQAQQSVVIETPYFAVTLEMKHLLHDLRRRGVAVTLVTNSFETNDHHSTQAIYEDAKRRYLRWGIDLWEIRGCDHHLHAKAAVIDGCIAVIGSYNFDELSQRENSEVAVAVYDAGVAAWLSSSIDCHMQLGYEIGRNTHPVGYDTRYPGATHKQRREIRVKRVVGPLIRKFE